jgi:hypothetical protein
MKAIGPVQADRVKPAARRRGLLAFGSDNPDQSSVSFHTVDVDIAQRTEGGGRTQVRAKQDRNPNATRDGFLVQKPVKEYKYSHAETTRETGQRRPTPMVSIPGRPTARRRG